MGNRPWTGRGNRSGAGLRRRRGRAALLAGAVALAGIGIGVGGAIPTEAAVTATVTVDLSRTLGTVPQLGQGLNMAVWDGHMNDSDQPALLSAAGVRALRYPGGSYGDLFHWKDNTAPGGYVAPNTSFDEFMTTARAVGAEPVLIANYGSGTAQEAADWVTYANRTKDYGVKYWEIGNEVYGNGHYGSGWERDDHADTSPRAYATNALEYIAAMKAVDPSIKVGIVLTTPGSWPDGEVAAGDDADWNTTVLSIVGDKADFGIIHWYPGASSAADSLGKSARQIPTMVKTLRDLFTEYGATDMGIAVTETNPNYQHDSATAGLFAADSYLTWWENGVFNVDWWNLRNGGDGKRTTNDDGTTGYQDEGIVSSGTSGEPALNTPFPPYYGLALAAETGAPGDTLVPAGSTDSAVAAHAVRTASGGVNVLLINKDLYNSATVTVDYSGFTPDGEATVRQWSKGASGISTATRSPVGGITVPAYSITLVRAAGEAAAPTRTEARTGALRGVGSGRCLDVAEAADGTPVTIRSCDGAVGQQWGLTSAGALRVHGTKCLGVPEGAPRGTDATVAACTGAATQRWTVGSDGVVVNEGTGLVLDVFGKRTADGSAVGIWPRNGGTNQQWQWR